MSVRSLLQTLHNEWDRILWNPIYLILPNALLGLMGLRKRVPALAVTANLGIMNDVMLRRGPLAAVEQAVTPFNLQIAEVPTCPYFVHLGAHFYRIASLSRARKLELASAV